MLTTVWSMGGYISKMHGCSDGCPDCQFTPDDPVAETT